MIIDFHTHLGKTVGKQEEHLLGSMDKARIDRSVIYAGEAMKFSNEALMSTIKKHPDRFYGALYGTPFDIPKLTTPLYMNSESQLREYHEYFKRFEDYLQHDNIIGMKFYCGYEYYYPHEFQLHQYFGLLEKYNKVAIFHTGDTYTVLNTAKLKYAQPLHIDEVAVDYPNLKIVIAHMGYPYIQDCAEILYKNKNVYADISGFVYGAFTQKDVKKFQKVIEEINFITDERLLKERLLFGTDWPISDQSSYIKTLHQPIDREFLKLDERELLTITSNNTIKFIDSIK